jgi:hypothetical protein
MIKKALLTLLGLSVLAVAGTLAVASTKPDQFHVERSITIKAPPEQIYSRISNIHEWMAWSPWEKKDPQMKRTFSGAESGKGAIYEWAGNDEVGAGRMEITEATAPTKVTTALHFIKPFEGDDISEFNLTPQGDSTLVTWSMSGPNPFMCKVMQVFMNLDQMCGKDFESGLASLKTTTEMQTAASEYHQAQ